MRGRKAGSLFHKDGIHEGPGRQLIDDLDRFFAREPLDQVAMQDERLRLAQELSDSLLRSLSEAELRLQALSRLIGDEPKSARDRLRSVQNLVAEVERELRQCLQKMQPPSPTASATAADLAAALNTLRQRAEWQWRFRVELGVDICGSVPRTLGDEVYRIVQEALANAGRHARAKVVRVMVKPAGADRLQIVISDDGCGFPFRGRYDLATLTAKGIGPRSLRERVSRLRGDLFVTSALSGSLLEIGLPVERPSPRSPPPNLPAG
ncbi:MAG TPA: histidine kinase [Casimicrobiaceae bacterium]|nr:histidine kinase [Casimicrobiaceae bacterium]